MRAYLLDARKKKFYHKSYRFTRNEVNHKKGNGMTESTNLLGNILLSYRAIATIACQSALESYGVVGLAPKNLAEGLVHVLANDPVSGVDIHYSKNSVEIDLYIVIEYGTRIKSVASSVADNVRYMVEKSIGISVRQVNVHVRGLRISNPD
jgi:uncharacterized alkaline shock family protein YloU